MIEVLLLVLLVVLLFTLIIFYYSRKQVWMLASAQRMMVSAQEQIKIAERRFMQGKIKKSVFDALLDDLEQELISAELILFRFRKLPVISVEDKIGEVVLKLGKSTQYRKSKIQRILTETELLREEMGLLESKLLRREIKQSVFEKLIKQKELLLIKKEKELMDVIELSK